MLKFLKFIFLLTCSFIAAGQANPIVVTYNNGGLCGTTILLSDDGTYKYESGCKTTSNVSFGTWVQEKDTIKFKPVDTKEFKILNIAPSKAENSKVLSVKLLDQTGKNITEKIIIKQYVQGKGYYDMELNSTKTERTDLFRDSGIVIVESLERIMNGTLGVQVDSFTNFEITINIPSEEVYQINSKWMNTGNFELLKTKDALVSVNFYPVDGENGVPARRKYKRSN